jgi:amino acid permease
METPPSSQEKKVSYEPPQQRPESISGTVHHLADRRTSIVSKEGEILNASGHRDQLQRQYGLLSICGIALNINSAWIVFGGSLAISVLNGGPPGIIYEFIVAVIFYSFIAASIAELASSMPTSGGVYHWASVTAGTWGRSIGFFCGALNFFGWVFGKFPGRYTIGLERGLLTIPQYVFHFPTGLRERFLQIFFYRVGNLLSQSCRDTYPDTTV